MLRVKIEYVPRGDEAAAQVLAEGVIVNDGTGSTEQGRYTVALRQRGCPGVWRKGQVEDFPRLDLGPWDLLLRALLAAVGVRHGRGRARF